MSINFHSKNLIWALLLPPSESGDLRGKAPFLHSNKNITKLHSKISHSKAISSFHDAFYAESPDMSMVFPMVPRCATSLFQPQHPPARTSRPRPTAAVPPVQCSA